MRYAIPFLLMTASVAVIAQDAASPPAESEVVSIKRHVGTDVRASVRTLPDGTTVITNIPISVALSRATSVSPRDVVGLPEWARTEHYDITVKGLAVAGRDQQQVIWRALFAERMKLVAHEEQREKDAFALVLARQDGRLGPQLIPSALDCTSGTPAAPPPPLTAQDFQRRCGIGGFANTLASGSIPMYQLALSLGNAAGGEIINRTGLEGRYAFTLTFSPQRTAGPTVETTPGDDAPDLFTAVQEQLGLKLQHEKKMTTVFVIDHIERPSEN
jgi:uncharacterized protein (TIGR03435 family)